MQSEQRKALEEKAHWVRCRVLEMATHAKSGHISSAFSQTELLVALYHGRLLNIDPKNPKWEKRDRFILSKGQGGIGLYPVLADMGFFPTSDLDDFAGRDSLLGVHAEHHIPGMEILSGSLGHGLPVATGMAQIGLLKKQPWLVVCLLGDAELAEGSNWEAALYAGSKSLSNLVCIVDRNGGGVIGYSDRVEFPCDGPRLNPLDKKFEAFGFEVRSIDGHDFDEIFTAFGDIRRRQHKKPLMIIANTHKGKGATIMEDQRLWHYRVPAGNDLAVTCRDLGLKSLPIGGKRVLAEQGE
jgi:transketolase